MTSFKFFWDLKGNHCAVRARIITLSWAHQLSSPITRGKALKPSGRGRSVHAGWSRKVPTSPVTSLLTGLRTLDVIASLEILRVILLCLIASRNIFSIFVLFFCTDLVFCLWSFLSCCPFFLDYFVLFFGPVFDLS